MQLQLAAHIAFIDIDSCTLVTIHLLVAIGNKCVCVGGGGDVYVFINQSIDSDIVIGNGYWYPRQIGCL
jgi:hypothetical protein